MKKFKENKGMFLIDFVLFILVFCLLIAVIFLCLDVLDIIDVPEKYSIAKYLNEYVTTSVVIDSGSTLDIEDNDDGSRKVIVKNTDQENDKTGDEIEYKYTFTGNYSDANTASNNDAHVDGSAKFRYYDQLDKYGKILYDEIENNIDKLKTGTYTFEYKNKFNDLLEREDGDEILNNAFQLAINSLNFDHPDLFYIDITKMYLLKTTIKKVFATTHEVSIGPSDGGNYYSDSFSNESEVKDAISKINNKKTQIISSAISSTNIKNQIKVVHDYIVDNVEYDTTISKNNIYNTYGTLIQGCSVCEGYARTFKDIMDEMGIECLVACGFGTNSQGQTESHAWNYVKIDDKWYAIDCTWDDPIIIGNGTVSEDVKYRYFLKGSHDFFENHNETGNIVRESNFKYPELSINNY